MQRRLRIEAEGGTVYATLPRYRTAGEVRKLFDASLEACLTSGARRLLLDVRANDQALLAEDYLHVADYVGEQGEAKNLRIAAVMRPEVVAGARLFQHMLRARAIDYRIFSSTQEAENWLRGGRSRGLH